MAVNRPAEMKDHRALWMLSIGSYTEHAEVATKNTPTTRNKGTATSTARMTATTTRSEN